MSVILILGIGIPIAFLIGVAIFGDPIEFYKRHKLRKKLARLNDNTTLGLGGKSN